MLNTRLTIEIQHFSQGKPRNRMMNVVTLKEQQGMRNAVDNILERHRMFTHR